MLRGRELTARVKSGKWGRRGKHFSKSRWKKENMSGWGWRELTCDVNVSGGGVQGRRGPGSTAVAGSDAFGSREKLCYCSTDHVS